jgi:ketosteroid isomerase-like protein
MNLAFLRQSALRILCSSLLLAGCAGPRWRGDGEPDRAALLEADTRFDADVAARGIEGWISWFEPSATSWRTREELSHDREIYRTTLGPLFAKPGTHLRWQPAYAEAGGDLGYTTGRWQQVEPDGAGKDKEKTTATGHYVTIWRRQPGGAWRVIFDLGNEDR